MFGSYAHPVEEGAALWGKHSTFERALRSPLLIRTPAMPSPGRSTDGLVETLDLYPTLADLCGLTPPDDLTGVSLVPLLNDPDHPGKDGAFGYWNGRTRFGISEGSNSPDKILKQVQDDTLGYGLR